MKKGIDLPWTACTRRSTRAGRNSSFMFELVAWNGASETVTLFLLVEGCRTECKRKKNNNGGVHSLLVAVFQNLPQHNNSDTSKFVTFSKILKKSGEN
jgi:hypothetical protein